MWAWIDCVWDWIKEEAEFLTAAGTFLLAVATVWLARATHRGVIANSRPLLREPNPQPELPREEPLWYGHPLVVVVRRTLRVRNIGTGPAVITGVTLNAPWEPSRGHGDARPTIVAENEIADVVTETPHTYRGETTPHEVVDKWRYSEGGPGPMPTPYSVTVEYTDIDGKQRQFVTLHVAMEVERGGGGTPIPLPAERGLPRRSWRSAPGEYDHRPMVGTGGVLVVRPLRREPFWRFWVK